MASELKYFLFPDYDRQAEVAAEESSSLEQYLRNDSAELHEPGRDFELPDVIGILPIRNAVAFPGTVTPLAIGRERSRRLLENTKPNESIIGLVTQRNPETDMPNFDELYTVGAAATILKVIKMPQGPAHIIVHSLARFKIVKPVGMEPYLKAKVRLLECNARMTKKLQALIVSVRQTANRVIALSPNVPEEASVLVENIDNPSALA
ncbi:MAG: LON peptidase substrate-binding domain-containing protein, partial [Planctomycetota bacterium]